MFGIFFLLLLFPGGLCRCWAQWVQLSNKDFSQTESLPALQGPCAAYSPNLDSIVMFGGEDASSSSRMSTTLYLYSFANQSWNFLHALSPSPPGRKWATLTLAREDANSSQFILIGGAVTNVFDSTMENSNADVWLLTITVVGMVPVWQIVEQAVEDGSNASPGAINLHRSLVRNDKLYVFGGNRFDFGAYRAQNNLFELNLQSLVWREIKPITGEARDWPSPRFGHGLALHPFSPNAMILYGGHELTTMAGSNTVIYFADMWSFNFTNERWQLLNSASLATPPPGITNNNLVQRADFGMAIARSGDTREFIIFGGIRRASLTAVVRKDIFISFFNATSDLPQCNASFWCVAEQQQEDLGPSERFDFAFVVRRDELIVIAGANYERADAGGGNIHAQEVGRNDMWRLDRAALLQSKLLVASDQAPTADFSRILYLITFSTILLLMMFAFVSRNNATIQVSVTRFRGQGALTVREEQQQQHVLGAGVEFVQALPKVLFGELAKQSGADAEHNVCAICFDEFSQEDIVRVLACHHFYHPPCVDLWLTKHNSCPTCKKQVDPKPSNNNTAVAPAAAPIA